MSNSTPPGWYPVPGADGTAGHERWWDGAAWTSDVRPVQAGGGPIADAPTQVAWQNPSGGSAPAPPAYGYGAPQQGQPGYGYPAQNPPAYGYPPAAYPPPERPNRIRTGTAIGIVVGVLAVVGVVAAVALNSGGDGPTAKPTPTVATVTVTDTPSPSATTPSPTRSSPPPPTTPPKPSPVLKDTVADPQHAITVPVFEGWEANTSGSHSTVFLGSGQYTCPGGGNCIRGQFSVEKDTIAGTTARAAAEAAMPTYAAAIFSNITGHTDAGSSSTTVAGISGYAVRWHITTSDGSKGYILMVAVPAKGGGFVAFEGGVDDAAGAPDPSVLDQILKGIKQDTSEAAGSNT
ncbi:MULTISPECIES: DUF2510 domain-containing protein [unclassified Streptomyces]|uniref:DUF2510 domain-containing protein n=1 Tax=unclassified Streptomyces TaxID=2593676 RepID=UPI0005F8E0D1|nr:MULTISPECIES: DUF2510 domain-containing protein [unclassified Streptomyces]KJY26674.1 hypothetical protein VR45_36515 [Streptomyces sp. NRRL S-495]KOV26150.1 hypothetical protein ADK60_21875 [Streptomyces sp. XY431]